MLCITDVIVYYVKPLMDIKDRIKKHEIFLGRCSLTYCELLQE